MARTPTPAQIATKAAKNSGLKTPGKSKRTRKIHTAGPRKRSKATKTPSKASPLHTTIPGIPPARAQRRLYKINTADSAITIAQIIGVLIALGAFIGIIYAIVHHAYANRPSRTMALAQAEDFKKAQENCGAYPYLVETVTTTYGEKRVDYYAPGHESYDKKTKEPPADENETKRFDCKLDSALIAYATPHYADNEKATIAKIYKEYAASKGMKFLAPTYLPNGYSLIRQTLSSTNYMAAFSATGNEKTDGYFTDCGLLRDAPDRSKVTTYRNTEHTLHKAGNLTVYGDRNYTIDNTQKDVARFAEVGDMWCSFSQNGERYISNEDITQIMSSFAAQADDVVLQATPVASD